MNMYSMITFWLLITIRLFRISAASIYINDGVIAYYCYVRPFSARNVTCPDQPCLTFNEYARDKDQYFLDGVSFMFLSGIHQFDLQLQLENISNVSFDTFLDDSVQILLSPMANITWIDCSNITITGLEVYLSGTKGLRTLFSAFAFERAISVLSRLHFFGNDSLQSTAINIHSSMVELKNVTVTGATSLLGVALVVFNSIVNFTRENQFINNTATQGGAIYILQSFAHFDGRVSLIHNTAAVTSGHFALGGAVYIDNSIVLFSGSVLFQRNQAISNFASGGGIFLVNSILIFDITSSVAFVNNSATLFGGAMSISGSKLTILGKALFEENFAMLGGGALWGENVSKVMCRSSTGKITFRNNHVDIHHAMFAAGGAIFTNSSYVELEGVLFEGNTAGGGGAIASEDIFFCILSCDFYNNSAYLDGSAVTFSGIFALFSGTNNFQWNFSVYSGTMNVRFADVIFSGENNFLNNKASTDSGSLSLLSIKSGVICGNLTFHRNYAFKGGGLYGFQSDLKICGNLLFTENSALSSGGGMTFFQCYLNITGQLTFLQNSAGNSGSSVYIEDSNVMISGSMNISGGFGFKNPYIDGSIKFRNCTVFLIGPGVLILENSTTYMGGAISAENSEMDFVGCIKCIKNVAYKSGGALFATNSTIRFRNNSDCNVLFQTNKAHDRGGAVYAVDSTISLSGSITFLFNSANQTGGSVAIDSNSKLVLVPPLQADFIDNSATVGGAIFHEDVFSASQCASTISKFNSYCFLELNSTSNIQLRFHNNTASSAGTVLYGGNLDNCRLYTGGGVSDSCGNRIGGNYSRDPIATIEQISETVSINNVTSNISSDPLQVCFCENGILDLNCSNHKEIDIIRGKEFTLMALVVGQNYGIVPSSVRTSLNTDIEISAAQRIQSTGKECTAIKYRLSSIKNTTHLVLFPDGPCRDVGISRRMVTINFLPCPDGFSLDGSECVCEERLQKYTNSCNVDDNSITRASNTFWMGAVYENGTFGGLILHSGCPFDYCVDSPASIHLHDLNTQCDHNHSGILCGSCINGYSITFGTLHCLPCSNVYLALILPFAIAGIVLVAILLLLNISVASGTINGLIFYANVVQVNRSIFFPPGDTNILTVFIAWLNLDLGIETCFFDGMNTYIYTWLQYIFPLYVWFLIGLMIVLSRFSTKIARALGRNPVATLATLFLLSYSKVLRTIIAALSFTTLEYPGNIHRAVWLYDGNVPYFQSASHIVMGTVAIVVLLLLFLPYTLLLLTGHWLQAYSDRRIFSWLNKIMPFMDAYHAPYKKESRYWTGLLLLVRCALFLTFAFNTLGNVSCNLLAIVSVTAGLMVLAWLRLRVYKSILNNYLEGPFLFNLCILAAGTYHVKEIGGNQAALAYTSVGITFILVVCIVLYHMYLRVRLRTTLLWNKIYSKNRDKLQGRIQSLQ